MLTPLGKQSQKRHKSRLLPVPTFVCKRCAFFLHAVLQRPRFRSRAFGCGARNGSVDTCLDRGRAPRRVLRAFKVADLAILSRGCVPRRWAKQVHRKLHNCFFFFKQLAPLFKFLSAPLSRPLYNIDKPNYFHPLCCLLRRSYIQPAPAKTATEEVTAARLSKIIHVCCI